MGGRCVCVGTGGYGNCLYFLLRFAVNLNCFKIRSLLSFFFNEMPVLSSLSLLIN